ncbi:Rv3235 family protein [Spirillospora sp. CA-294931]|uniref:Rv3235 family protein n=1 Tax=Spirillospora sp. CA-294931 TaxID=3240042 RepID=UPI003D91C91D
MPGIVRLVPPVHPTSGALALAAQPVPASGRPGLRVVSEDTDPRMVAEATLRLVAEVLAGTRTSHHLSRRAHPLICEGLSRLSPAPTRVRPPRVLVSWVQMPVAGVIETGGVVEIAGRVRALALRLELWRGRWRCTALETCSA